MVSDCGSLQEALNNIINKDVKLTLARMKDKTAFNREVRYAIEVKFLHSVNSHQKALLDEVIKDSEKLNLAWRNSNGFTRTINLVFCSYTTGEKRSDGEESIITKVRKYCGNGNVIDYSGTKRDVPDNVLTIFTQAFLEGKEMKSTPKPVSAVNPGLTWSVDLRKLIKAE
jgi:hypothetical protein